MPIIVNKARRVRATKRGKKSKRVTRLKVTTAYKPDEPKDKEEKINIRLGFFRGKKIKRIRALEKLSLTPRDQKIEENKAEIRELTKKIKNVQFLQTEDIPDYNARIRELEEENKRLLRENAELRKQKEVQIKAPLEKPEPTVQIRDRPRPKLPFTKLTRLGGPVTSSVAAAVWWAPETQIMEIEFHPHTRYIYFDIPYDLFISIHDGMDVAKTKGANFYGRWWPGKFPSVGAAIHNQLKTRGYRYQRIT